MDSSDVACPFFSQDRDYILDFISHLSFFFQINVHHLMNHMTRLLMSSVDASAVVHLCLSHPLFMILSHQQRPTHG